MYSEALHNIMKVCMREGMPCGMPCMRDVSDGEIWSAVMHQGALMTDQSISIARYT